MMQIGVYLRDEEVTEQHYVTKEQLTRFATYRHDVVNPSSKTSATFTKSYGGRHLIGVGSLLQTESFDYQIKPDNIQDLLSAGIRFFTPNEIALLHGLPVDNGFQFPSELSESQKWKLIGNSLNIKVVKEIIKNLIKDS
jgi:tRNA (cytosine38-C5)-methyltransferase